MRIFLFGFLLVVLAILNTSCIVRTNRVLFAAKVPLTSKYYEFNKDSLQFLFQIVPNNRNVVIPLMIFKGNKKKVKIAFGLYGKGISAREYTITYTGLVIKNDSTLLGKSKDPNLFTEQIITKDSKGIISPHYGTGYILSLAAPKKASVNVHFEFEIKNRAGLSESYDLNMPLEKIVLKSYTFFNPFK